MTGNFYIDNQDIYSAYRIFVAKDGYKELVSFAPLKPVNSNNWAEEDGEEFDLYNPVLDTRELSIRFVFHWDGARFGAFIELLSDGAYHEFDFTEIGKKYMLRLVSQPNLSILSTLGVFTLRFADDFPLSDYLYKAPQSDIVPQQEYWLDGRNLSEYGVHITRGTEAQVLISPNVKKNLLQNLRNQSGAVYDGKNVFFQTKDVKLNCLMRANSLEEFWKNYNALLFDLIRQGERLLYFDKTMEEYSCYYKSCSVSNFIPSGKIWFEFSLILVFTNFRANSEIYLLTTKNEEFIVTENDMFIELLV